MKKYWKRIVKLILLFCVTCVLFTAVQNVLRHKCIYKLDETPETEMWEEFYSLKKNSVDVFFVGSSHVYNGINTPLFYELTGNSAFNLASSNQDYFTAYYMIREGLKNQNPKLIVLETYGCHQRPFTDKDYDKNTYYKMAFDDMKFSGNKLKAVTEWKKNNSEINIMERLFPVFEYHSRWDNLNPTDYSSDEKRSVIMGYAGTFKRDMEILYVGYTGADEELPCTDPALEYLDKIKELCDSKGIELVLTTVPDSVHNPGKSLAIAHEAEKRELVYIDYNDSSNLSRLGISNSGWRDKSHMNFVGAEALTKGIAADLTEMGIVESKPLNNAEFNRAVSRYERLEINYRLRHISDFSEYLGEVCKLASTPGYLVAVGAKYEATAELSPEDIELLNMLVPAMDPNDYYGRSIAAIKTSDYSDSAFDLTPVSLSGELPGGIGYELESVGLYAANGDPGMAYVEFKIGGKEYAVNEEGLNIFVYDLVNKETVDSCCFATYDYEETAIRASE